MRRKPVVLLSTLALAAIGLTGCGSDAEETGTEAEPTTAETTAPEAPTAPAAVETEDTEPEPTQEPEGDAEDAPATGADLPDPGPAPEGAVIPTAALEEPPMALGEYKLRPAEGPAHIYADEMTSVMISVDTNVLGSPYEQLAEYIETDNTPAGTGSCGTNESGSSITCYQRTEDGVITLNASPDEISLEDMVVFVNQYAAAAGAA